MVAPLYVYSSWTHSAITHRLCTPFIKCDPSWRRAGTKARREVGHAGEFDYSDYTCCVHVLNQTAPHPSVLPQGWWGLVGSWLGAFEFSRCEVVYDGVFIFCYREPCPHERVRAFFEHIYFLWKCLRVCVRIVNSCIVVHARRVYWNNMTGGGDDGVYCRTEVLCSTGRHYTHVHVCISICCVV